MAARRRSAPAGSAPVDCVISADPVAFLLVGLGRITQWEAIALGLLSAFVGQVLQRRGMVRAKEARRKERAKRKQQGDERENDDGDVSLERHLAAWKIGQAIKPLSGFARNRFSPENLGSKRVVRPPRRATEESRRCAAQPFIFGDLNGPLKWR